MFLAQVCDGDVSDISLEDVILFFSGTDRVPHQGFGKKIEIYFDDNINLPSVNMWPYGYISYA